MGTGGIGVAGGVAVSTSTCGPPGRSAGRVIGARLWREVKDCVSWVESLRDAPFTGGSDFAKYETLDGLHRYAVRGHKRRRVDGVVTGGRIADMDLEMAVRAGRVTGRADNTDGLPGRDGLPDPHARLSQHVTVPRDDVAGVANLHVPAAPANTGATVGVARQRATGRGVGVACHVAQHGDHDPGRGGTDHRAPGRGNVDPVVGRPVRGAEPGHDRPGYRADPPVRAHRYRVTRGQRPAGVRLDDLGCPGLVLLVRVRVRRVCHPGTRRRCS
jgi:hypothetical protein